MFQHDAEGNSTQVPWHVKNQYFYVYHQYNEVYGNDWSPDSTITLTIEEQSWTTQSDSYGWFYMYLSPFDIIPGQSIHVTDGIDNRTQYTVKNLDLTGFDIDTDTLTGTADPGELLLNVYSNGDGYSQEPIANEEGVWITDFSGTQISPRSLTDTSTNMTMRVITQLSIGLFRILTFMFTISPIQFMGMNGLLTLPSPLPLGVNFGLHRVTPMVGSVYLQPNLTFCLGRA